MQNKENDWDDLAAMGRVLNPVTRRRLRSKQKDDLSFPLAFFVLGLILYVLLFNDFDHYNLTVWYVFLPLFAGTVVALAKYLRSVFRKLISRKRVNGDGSH